MVLNHVIEKGKTRCKLSYKVFKEEHVYNPIIDISTLTALIQLKDFPGGIHHCITVVGEWVFDSNVSFALPLTQYKLEYYCIHDNEKNERMVNTLQRII